MFPVRFRKFERLKFQITARKLIYDNNKPFMVYSLASLDGKFRFNSIPEPAKKYLGAWVEDGVVGKYANYSDFDGHLLTSYVDVSITYSTFSKRLESALIDDVEVFDKSTCV